MIFYLKFAFKNLVNNKKLSVLFASGLIISLTVVTSLNLWFTNSERFLLEDFASEMDYDIQVKDIFHSDYDAIEDWLNSRSEVHITSRVYHNSVFFNIEEKDPFYEYSSFWIQENLTDPALQALLFLPSPNTLSRIAKQFMVNGSFSLKEKEVLLSKFQAQQLSIVYNSTIHPNMVVNLSVCRNSPELSELGWLFPYQPKHFLNVTVRGIYELIPSHTILQKTWAEDTFYNSAIFLSSNLLEEDISIMEENGLLPTLFCKLTTEYLMESSVSGLPSHITAFVEILKVNNPTVFPTILDDLLNDLSRSFIQEKLHFVVLIPIVFLCLVISGYYLTQIINSRKKEVIILHERNATHAQIIGLFQFEFLLIIIFASIAALLLSYILTSLVLSITSTSLTSASFKNFFSSLSFPTLGYFSSVAFIILTLTIQTILQTKNMINRTISETVQKETTFWKKVLFLAISSVFSICILGLLIYFIVKLRQVIVLGSTFTMEQIRSSSYILLFLLLLSFCLLLFLTMAIVQLLSKSKKFFVKLFPKFGYLLNHNITHEKSRLGILLFIILSISFSTVFSFSLSYSITQAEQSNTYYNNGADLRIHTLPVEYQYSTNLTKHKDIETAFPLFEISGKISTDRIIIYGVNPLEYAAIGRWDPSSFSKSYLPKEFRTWTPSELIERLDDQPYGIIISEGLAKKYGYEFEEIIRIDDIEIPWGEGSSQFIVVGIIHSAPGLGLASQTSQYLNQPNDDFVIINELRMILDYQINEVSLFFANAKETAQIELLSQEVQNMVFVLDVNPNLVIEGLSNEFIRKYIPNLQFFLNVNIILICIPGLLVMNSVINFVHKFRERSVSILFSMGLSHSSYLKIIFVELSLLLFIGIILGLFFGFLMSFLTFSFVPPLIKRQIVIPLVLSVNPLMLLFMVAALILTSFINLIASISKKSKTLTLSPIK